VQQFLTLDEFRRQETVGNLGRKMQTFRVGDRNLQITISYSKQPPFVEGDTVLMFFSTPVEWLGFGPADARNLAQLLIDHAEQAEASLQ